MAARPEPAQVAVRAVRGTVVTADSSSSATARQRELWSLREDVRLEGDAVHELVRLRGRWGDITIPRPSPLVRETLNRMALGTVSLENAASAAMRPAGGTYLDTDEARARLTAL